jgi:hypothetical protein
MSRSSGAFGEEVFERQVSLPSRERRSAPDANQTFATGLGRGLNADDPVPGVAVWAVETGHGKLGHCVRWYDRP